MRNPMRPALVSRLSSMLAAVLAALPSPALALEASYHSYDGFEETVDAFRLVSMIFADPRYETLVLIMAIAGIALGAVLASIRGQGMGLVAFGFQILMGVGLFVGFVATTGTVHVYDRVRNAYQAVGDVPNLLVLVAGTTNLIERSLAETIDDNTLDPAAKLEFGAGGHAFNLFFNAASPRGPMTDTFLDATLKDYVRQCYPVARVSPAYGVDDDMLFRTTTDLPAAFAAMAGPATFSTVYTAANKGGETMSCADAWEHISARLADPTLFDDYVRQSCIRTGFDVDDATQLARCRSQLGEMGEMMMGTPLSLAAFMTDVMLGTTVGDVLFEDSPATAARVMANRAVISNGLATMSAANEWMPTIRATIFGIMLFMVPVALLFVLTPINLRVLSYALGLFVFVALWGVIDAGIYQLTLGRAMDVLAEMRANHVAANAWMLAPSSAMKALAIFGTFRTAAAGLAGAFVFTVFRFSGNMFSSLTGASQGIHTQAAGASAPMATSEGYASALEAQGSALGTAHRKAAASSFGDFGERTSFAASRSFGEAGTIIGEGSPTTPGQSALSLGGLEAQRQLGGLAPALAKGDLTSPEAAKAVRANATTSAIHQFAEKDALRSLGTRYFGEGQTGERAFAAFAQTMVQWKAFGDNRAYAMMHQAASRQYERGGYDAQDAELKATSIIAEASSDPTFGKLIANAWDQEQMLRNDLTGAQVQVGAMEGRRDFAGQDVAPIERSNVATEQAHRTGGNHARFSFAGNDLLVSSSAGFQKSARSDTSTRFEAGKQAGPDTIEHFLGGGQEGHDMMARWLKGGFEMDRHGQWRLKPQVADTLQRDVQAVMSQTGWTRSLARSADHQISDSITFGANISGRSVEFGRSDSPKGAKSGAQASGQSGFQLSGRSSDTGTGSTRASATIDIMNYDVRAAIAKAEQRAARSNDPHQAFTHELSEQILGTNGMRNRYLGQADAGRGTFDPTAPVTSFEQSKVLGNGRFSGDLRIGPGDGDPTFKKR